MTASANEYVALVGKQYKLQQFIKDKQQELSSLTDQKSSSDTTLGQEIYQAHETCCDLSKLHELYTFYHDTVLLYIINFVNNPQYKSYQRKVTWPWIDQNADIWKDWDSLLAYINDKDTRNKLLESWEGVGELDVSGAGSPTNIHGFEIPNLRRFTKSGWQGIIDRLDADMQTQETALGVSARRQYQLIQETKSVLNNQRSSVLEKTIADTLTEWTKNEMTLRSMKASLGLPIDD